MLEVMKIKNRGRPLGRPLFFFVTAIISDKYFFVFFAVCKRWHLYKTNNILFLNEL
jgi:hypothetical protein